MGDPDCFMCAVAGFRTCDACGGIVFDPRDDPDGEELCAECVQLLPDSTG